MAPDKSKNGSIASMDTELVRLVTERQLATAEEVSRCRQIAQKESDRSLAEVLIAQDVVTRAQIERIKKTLQDAPKDRQIPGYRLLSRLGSGAMATVYKGVQEKLNRPVAIKVLAPKLSQNAEYVKLFYKEGQAAAKLNHPNIVQAIDVGEAGGFHYFVMEFVEGHTLYDELAAGKIFTEAEALKIILQVAKALKHAHDQGLIHRDVKPKNIIITPDGTVKLADMGLARAASDLDAAQAEAGRAFGTPYYISPEQIRGEMDIDFRADIYSLGATLYHLVTGRVPFEAPTPVAVMHKHLKEPLVPPDHLNTSLSAGIGEVVEIMMSKDRSRRYASTADLLMDLQAIANGEAPLQARRNVSADLLTGLAGGSASGPAATASASSAGGSASRWTTGLIVLIAALVLSALLNIILVVTR